MDYEMFTAGLENLNRMKKESARMKSRLDDLIYLETGVKGISYDKLPTSHNPSQVALNRLKTIDKIDALAEKKMALDSVIEILEYTLSRMPQELQNMLTDKFIRKWTYDRVGLKYGYSHSGIQYKLKNETEKYL